MAEPEPPPLPYDVDAIRRVLDDESPPLGAISTPREDARKLRTSGLLLKRKDEPVGPDVAFGTTHRPEEDVGQSSPRRGGKASESYATTAECILEMYELLWRWGNLDRKHREFRPRYGFEIPSSVVVVKGRPYAWYFMSSTGALLRKKSDKLQMGKVEQDFTSGRTPRSRRECDIVAVWYPMATQFPADRCPDRTAKFLSAEGLRSFLSDCGYQSSGVLQKFIPPHGIYNFLVRAVQFHDKVSLCMRMNRYLLAKSTIPAFKRCATFEGWGGISSSVCKYENSKHPMMEERILRCASLLSQRIAQERVRPMHFLVPSQYIAMHFKVDPDGQLFFSYASVVDEVEVMMQTQKQLMMEDVCMRAPLPHANLLPGARKLKLPQPEEAAAELDEEGEPPLTLLIGNGKVPETDARPKKPLRPLPQLKPPQESCLPRIHEPKPLVPGLPYSMHGLPKDYFLSARPEGMKVPLVSFGDESIGPLMPSQPSQGS